jgi:hypothetical protein
MIGQVGFFALRSIKKVPLAIDRFVAEVGRLFGVLERRLATSPYLAEVSTSPDSSNAESAAPHVIVVLRLRRAAAG